MTVTDAGLTDLVIETLGLSEEQAAALQPGTEDLVVVSAGAGTGKTTTMAARYALTVLRELSRGDRAPSPGRAIDAVAAVTFTELAAAELKSRIGDGLRRVAEALAATGRGAVAEPTLEAVSRLSDAPIGTIHGLCARLLRRPEIASAAGISPEFWVLDALASQVLWDRAVEEALNLMARTDAERISRVLAVKDGAQRLSPLVRGLAERVPTRALETLAARSRGAFARDAAEAAVALLHQTACQDTVAAATAEADRRRVALGRVVGSGLASSLDALVRWSSGTGSGALATVRVPSVGATDKRLAALEVGDAAALEAFAEALRRFKRVADRVAAGLATPALDAEYLWTGDVIAVSLQVRRSYEELKGEQGALDFADLEQRALAALCATTTSGGRPFRSILVDELQDTSRVQRDLLHALLGDSLAGLFAVGDPKQSIYRFRQADVSVFQELLVRAGDNAITLTTNRRSSPHVLAFVNALFAELLPAQVDPRRPYLAPAQALTAYRAAAPPEELGTWPPLVFAPVRVPAGDASAAQLRAKDAEACGHAVRGLLTAGARVAVLLRAVRGGHRAYLDVLDGLGVTAELAASGTFTREAATALGIGLARGLAVPGHDAAWTALLRSPLVGLCDRDVKRLCRWAAANGQPVIEGARWLLASEPLLLGPRGVALERLLGAVSQGAELHRRMRSVLDAGGIHSRQLDKLLLIVADLEAEGCGPAEVVEVLERVVEGDRSKRVPDPRATEQGEHGPELQALTIHASKGLEFQTVVVPQLFASAAPGAFATPHAAWVDGAWRVGLGVPRGAPSVMGDANRALELQREQAEQARLLYVALTRARDRIVVVLPDGNGDPRERAETPVVAAIRRIITPAARRSGRATLHELEVPLRWLDLAQAAAVPPDAGAIEQERPVGRRPGPALALDGPIGWPVTDLARLAFCPAYYAQVALAPALLAGAVEPSHGRTLRGRDRGIEVHDLLATLRGVADLDELVEVPPALRGEWPALSLKIRALMESPRLAPLFTPQGLWRESSLDARVDGVPISGALDRLALRPSEGGRVDAVVGEFKTGGRGFAGPGGHEPAYEVAHRFQLAAYVTMLKGWLGDALAEPVTTHLVFVDLNQVLTEHWTTARAVAEVRRVVAEIHRPYALALNRQACPDCSLNASCAAR